MNLTELQQKLLRAARMHPPSVQVPYAFEKRIMARLRAFRVGDYWTLWERALWRAAAPCIAITLVVMVWSLLSPEPRPEGNLSAELENVVFASLEDQITDPL